MFLRIFTTGSTPPTSTRKEVLRNQGFFYFLLEPQWIALLHGVIYFFSFEKFYI